MRVNQCKSPRPDIGPEVLSPYADWFSTLNAQAAAKIVTAKLRLGLGNTSNVKWFSSIGEYVIDWAPLAAEDRPRARAQSIREP
jgi:hypothetical protein